MGFNKIICEHIIIRCDDFQRSLSAINVISGKFYNTQIWKHLIS